MKKIYDIPEAAEITGFTPKAIRQKIARGQFPCRRWGGRVIIPADDLEKFIAALPGVSAEEALAKAEAAQR